MNTRLGALAAAVAVAGIATTASAATNLIRNGDFSDGYNDFGSDYTAVAESAWNEGTYSIVGNPRDVHPLWESFSDDHTGDDAGKMMVVNGAVSTGETVWEQNEIAIEANTTYFFSTWIRSVYPVSPARLAFSINGEQIGSTFTAGAVHDGWQQFYAEWNSGSNTSAFIGLVNRNTEPNGNDFALDDIAFWTERPGAAVPEPAAWALMITGFGSAGAMLRRRRAVAA